MGKRLKDPYKPIWVVNSESHFSVLFGSDLGLAERESGAMGAHPAPDTRGLDLYYYDELANQDDIIVLTLRPSGPAKAFGFVDGPAASEEPDEDKPPLEKVIETRWPRVTVDWNGAEPIL